MEKVKHIGGILLITVSLVTSSGCQEVQQASLKEERSEILALHNAQREYHFKKDSIAFAEQLSEHFISVNRGEISSPSREETISRYDGYFSSVDFLKWDDESDPIIRFSDDGSMAYTIVDKIVAVTYTDEEGTVVEGRTHFAWTAIYKKYGDSWKIDCVTSTERPVAED